MLNFFGKMFWKFVTGFFQEFQWEFDIRFLQKILHRLIWKFFPGILSKISLDFPSQILPDRQKNYLGNLAWIASEENPDSPSDFFL